MGLVGFASRDRAPRSAVPAWDPLMPASDMMPMAAAVSSRLWLMELATGATYFMASPMSSVWALVRAAASANTSATWEASEASSPNPRMAEAAISEEVAKSAPEEAAKSSMPGMAAIISSTVKPALARFSMPWATSEAEKEVSAPSCSAWASRASISVEVAPAMACTRSIWASKSLPIVTAAVPMAKMGAVTPAVRVFPRLDTFPPMPWILSPALCSWSPTRVAVFPSSCSWFSKVISCPLARSSRAPRSLTVLAWRA